MGESCKGFPDADIAAGVTVSVEVPCGVTLRGTTRAGAGLPPAPPHPAPCNTVTHRSIKIEAGRAKRALRAFCREAKNSTNASTLSITASSMAGIELKFGISSTGGRSALPVLGTFTVSATRLEVATCQAGADQIAPGRV